LADRLGLNRKVTSMKTVVMAVALFALAAPSASAQLQVKEVAPKAAPGTSAPKAETSGGEAKTPEPHIYKLGDHLSEAYGDYELVDNWQNYRLERPPEGHHWVRYGDNYLLVTVTDGLIKRIVHAS
jgi:Ni/Co efflux regulator RcnB